MADECCEVPNTSEKKQKSATVSLCPRCEKKGLPVDILTLRHQLKPPRNFEINESAYFFCRTHDCPVVYFSADGKRVFEKNDLRLRVGVKETSAPHDLCYCFGFTKEMIEEDIQKNGKTDIPLKISTEVKAGNCACEYKNPKGSCCLGDIQSAIQHAKATMGGVQSAA